MAKFDGHIFCLLCSHLATQNKSWREKRDAFLDAAARQEILDDMEFVQRKCTQAGLINTAAYIADNVGLIVENVTYGYVNEAFGNLAFQMRSEMKRAKFLTVDKPEFYGESPLFESFVTDIYPQLTYDIVEAGNCLALDRTTACAFHLMRVMEFGVQRFGQKLGVPLVNESVWQVIMDGVNKRIVSMPDKPAAKKRLKVTYADVSGHLYSVKVAWRNPVMHPKKTYTTEEARRLFDTVKAFMNVLVKMLKPKTVKDLQQNNRVITSFGKAAQVLGAGLAGVRQVGTSNDDKE
jgi:hypothetical protein